MKLFYLVIKAWVWLSLRLFYHEIQVYGKENIPKDAAVIFISNHFNTLLDPLLIVSSIQKKVWFLTRADVFKKKDCGFFTSLGDHGGRSDLINRPSP
ncbi:MAG: 1-acyl-sn-glycerol-3-phosphate acyltransferase, partial [Luteibaculum sp.]